MSKYNDKVITAMKNMKQSLVQILEFQTQLLAMLHRYNTAPCKYGHERIDNIVSIFNPLFHGGGSF